MLADLNRIVNGKTSGAGTDAGSSTIVVGDVTIGSTIGTSQPQPTYTDEATMHSFADRLLDKMASDPRFAAPEARQGPPGPAGPRGPQGEMGAMTHDDFEKLIERVTDHLLNRMATDERFFG